MRVCLQYRLLAEDGEVIEQGHASESYCFTLGEGAFFEVVEKQLIDAAPGKRFRLRLSPGEAFGERDEQRVVIMPREQFGEELSLAEGQVMSFATPGGEEIAGQVMALSEAAVQVDFNHPLAGKTLICEGEVVSVDEAASA